MAAKHPSTDPDQERWLKRQALNLIAQLPDDPATGAEILLHAMNLWGVICVPGTGKKTTAEIVRPDFKIVS